MQIYEEETGQKYEPSEYDYRKYGDRPPTLALQSEHERRVDRLLAQGQTLAANMWGIDLLEVLAAEDAEAAEVEAEKEDVRQHRRNRKRVPHTAAGMLID